MRPLSDPEENVMAGCFAYLVIAFTPSWNVGLSGNHFSYPRLVRSSSLVALNNAPYMVAPVGYVPFRGIEISAPPE